MATFSLDDIREAAEKKFGSTDITIDGTVCRMVNPVRLPKDRRKALLAKQKELAGSDDETDETDVDQEQILSDLIRLVMENETQANILLGKIGDDLALLMATFEKYTGSQEAGEASASAG